MELATTRRERLYLKYRIKDLNDVNGEAEEFERMERERHRLEERDSTRGVVMSVSEDDKREANFSDFHGF